MDFIRFKDGGKLDVPLKKLEKTSKTGTKVRFWPDDEIFSTTNFSFTTVCERMQESAFLLEGITIEVTDEEKSVAVIENILPRKNEFQRPKVSNIDQAFLITSLKLPDFSLNLLLSSLIFSVIYWSNRFILKLF